MSLPFLTETTEAASTQTAFVNIKSGTLTVRSTASIKAKKVGSLKKYAKVKVYSTTKSGWSEIRYNKKKAYVSSKYLININIKNSRVTYSLKDINGNKYTVYIIGTNEKRGKATFDGNLGWNFVWAGANEGDSLYKGDYKIYLLKNGSQTASYTGYQYKDYTYNATRKMIYSVPSKYKGQPDLFAFAETMSSNGEEAGIYYVHKGKLKRAESLLYTYRPQVSAKNKYKIAFYNNGDAKWYVYTLSFNPTKGTFNNLNVKQYDFQKMYKWRKDWK